MKRENISEAKAIVDRLEEIEYKLKKIASSDKSDINDDSFISFQTSSLNDVFIYANQIPFEVFTQLMIGSLNAVKDQLEKRLEEL